MFLSINQYIMKLKLSILTILLFFLSASFPLAAQKAPQPFDIDTPSLRVFLPAPELATGRAIVRVADMADWLSTTKAMTGHLTSTNKASH